MWCWSLTPLNSQTLPTRTMTTSQGTVTRCQEEENPQCCLSWATPACLPSGTGSYSTPPHQQPSPPPRARSGGAKHSGSVLTSQCSANFSQPNQLNQPRAWHIPVPKSSSFVARSVDNNKGWCLHCELRLFHYLHKLSASASLFFEWYPSVSSFRKGFPGRACVVPEELFLFPGLHYSLNVKHVLCHYSQHVLGGQFGVVTISFWDYLWSRCQTAPFAKPKAQGGKYTPALYWY